MATAQNFDHLRFYVDTGGGSHQERRELAVIGRQQSGTVFAVAVQDPLGEQETRPLVALAERLCLGYPISDDRRRGDRVVNAVYDVESPLQPVELVGLVKPLIVVAGETIERDSQFQGRPYQWSWR